MTIILAVLPQIIRSITTPNGRSPIPQHNQPTAVLTPLNTQAAPSRSRNFATQEAKRPLSHPHAQPSNGRSRPNLSTPKSHSGGLVILQLRKPNGRSAIHQHTQPTAVLTPISHHPSRTQSVSKFRYSGTKRPFSIPQHNQPTAVIPSQPLNTKPHPNRSPQ